MSARRFRLLVAVVTATCALSVAPAAAVPADVRTCTADDGHRTPVVLLHGTLDDATVWNELSAQLRSAGYCVYAPTYGATGSLLGLGGAAPVAQSAAEVAEYISRVLEVTGARQVDLVGHSQGGTIAAYYAKVLGRAARVRSAILLAPVSHGTTLGGAVETAERVPGLRGTVDSVVLPVFCAACADLETGSAFLDSLDAGPIAQPGVRYAVLATRDDAVSTPPGTASFIDEPGVTNLFVQELNPAPVLHRDLPRDATSRRWILEQLNQTTRR
ncbi:esterase/lipase family protein [Nocardia brasiliensis]|uniref:esterase/lipase family protein n=1 Tax=Nocardia brasiliensis TaxID=37326 RepID=UPI002455FE27|nr:alpha/beta fold hydrolase [Nocardia brasiliensis]